MSDTPNGETVQTGASQTPVQTPATPSVTPAPVVNAVDQAEVERLRKEAEQARIRANQLQNELEAKKKAEEEAKLKQLEEQNEWKSVAEQTQAKLDELEKEREDERIQSELQSETSKILSTFSDEVVALANDMGLSLNDTSEESKEALKQKLEKISARVTSDGKPSPNNPAPVSTTQNRDELFTRARRGDKNAKAELISSIPAVQEMRRQAGFK